VRAEDFAGNAGTEDLFEQRSREHTQEKKIMAQLAADLLPRNVTIFADSSTTVLEVLKLLKDRDDITVLTNSVPALILLNQSKLNLISTGGVINRLACSLQGFLARNAIMNFHVDYMLTSCRELKYDDGAYDSRESETEQKRIMAARAGKVILMADHSKFDKVSFVKYCGFDQIDTLITDRKPSDRWMEMLVRRGIKTVCPVVAVPEQT